MPIPTPPPLDSWDICWHIICCESTQSVTTKQKYRVEKAISAYIFQTPNYTIFVIFVNNFLWQIVNRYGKPKIQLNVSIRVQNEGIWGSIAHSVCMYYACLKIRSGINALSVLRTTLRTGISIPHESKICLWFPFSCVQLHGNVVEDFASTQAWSWSPPPAPWGSSPPKTDPSWWRSCSSHQVPLFVLSSFWQCFSGSPFYCDPSTFFNQP